MAGQFHKVLAHQRLAAGEEHHRRAVGRQIVDHFLGLFGGNLIAAILFHGLRIAMHALEIATAGHVPDHDWFLVLGELEKVRRKLAGMPTVTQRVGGLDLPAIKLGNADHRLSLHCAPGAPGFICAPEAG